MLCQNVHQTGYIPNPLGYVPLRHFALLLLGFECMCLLSLIINLDSFLSHSLSHPAGSVVYLGMMMGAFFWGGMSDKVGRRQCLLICMSMNGFFAFLSSFVQGYGFFLVCRMIAGFGWVFCSTCWTFFMLCLCVNEMRLIDKGGIKHGLNHYQINKKSI